MVINSTEFLRSVSNLTMHAISASSLSTDNVNLAKQIIGIYNYDPAIFTLGPL